MFQMMKTQFASTALIAVLLVMSVSGCASLTLQPTAEISQSPGVKLDSVEMQFGMARMLERKGKLTEAREAYQKILNSQPHRESLHRLGVTEIRQNRLDEGVRHLCKAVAAGDPSAELLGDFGYAQFLLEDLTAAETTLKKAVALDPSQKRNVNNLAIVVGKQDRLKESLQLFRQAASEAEALANLAFVQSQSDDLGKAKENYNKALDLDPELQVAAVGLLEVVKHIQPENGVRDIIEPQITEAKRIVPKAIETQVFETQVFDTQVVDTQVVETQEVDTQVVDTQVVDTQANATPSVRTVSWNQPATRRATPESNRTEASDQVLAKIMRPDPVETIDDATVKAKRDISSAAESQKDLAKQHLLSSIARLIDDADAAIDIVELPKD